MRSTNPKDEEDIDDTTMIKNGEVTNLYFVGIETMITPGKIFTDQNVRSPVTPRKGTI